MYNIHIEKDIKESLKFCVEISSNSTQDKEIMKMLIDSGVSLYDVALKLSFFRLYCQQRSLYYGFISYV